MTIGKGHVASVTKKGKNKGPDNPSAWVSPYYKNEKIPCCFLLQDFLDNLTCKAYTKLKELADIYFIPVAIPSGNPGFNSLKSWMPDRGIRA